jgi:putative aldouronate transport system substrate-binding protein
MKRSIRSICIVLALLHVIAGCQTPQPESNPSSDNGTQSVAEASTDAEGKTTLTIELFDRNDTPMGALPITDNYMTSYIQKHFGDPNGIKVEFVTIPRSEEVERLSVLMAANQAPDIVFTYDLPTVYKFAGQDKLTDLSTLLEKHGKDLINVLGEEVLGAGRFNGKQYAIPAKRVLRAHTTTIIREDWLQELGLPLPATTEQFYNALKAFKEKLPVKYGHDIFPFGHIDDYHTMSLQYSFWDWDQISEEDLYAKPSWLMPGNKEAFRFLNKLYNEGLMDPNFPLDKFAQQFRKDMATGRVGAGTPNTNEPVYMGYIAELQHNDPDAKLTPIDPFTSKNGKRPKPILEQSGMYIMVPKHSKHAEAAIQYLNWMARPENYITLQNGIEGVTYEVKDGLPVILQNEESKRMLYNYFDYCIILNGKFISSTDEERNGMANVILNPNYKAFSEKSIEYGMTDGIEKPQIKAILESEMKYSAILKEKTEESFVKVVTAAPEDFDNVYDKEVADYMRMGGEEVMNEKQRAFKNQR